MHDNRFQDLSRFVASREARGRPAWFVQFWWLFDALFVRPMPQALYGWRRLAWRMFGAKIGHRVLIRPGARVTFPWKLHIADQCWIGDDAMLYNIAEISIEAHSVISQGAYLCAATHDHRDLSFPLIASPITVEAECWIAARAFVGPGVRVQRGAVIGACAVVLSDVPQATVVAGNPARPVGKREPTEKPDKL